MMKTMNILAKDNKIQLDINNSFSGKRLVYASSDSVNFTKAEERELLFENGQSTYFETPLQRTFYKLELEEDCYIGAERRVAIEGLYNFRDLGGYFNTDGQMTKWGLVYRSDAPDHLKNEDCRYLKNMQFSSVIDFRSPAEIALNPDVNFGEKFHYNFDPHANIARKASETPEKKSAKDQEKVEKLVELSKSKAGQEKLIQMQQQMVVQMRELVLSAEAQAAYRDFLTVLLKAEVPNFFHCQGGKDRTGWAAAIFLGLLGVEKEMIYADYSLTNQYNRPRNEQRMSIYKRYTDNSFVLDYLASLQKTKSEYLDSAFQTMEKRYGTMEQYAKEALLLTEEDIQKLKDLYLYT